MSSTDRQNGKQRARDVLVEDLRRQIQDGALAPDDYLPSVNELAKTYGMSSRVVREGLAHLEAEGRVRGIQGRGTLILRRDDVPSVSKPRNVAVIFQGRVRDNSTAEELDGLQQAFQREGFGTILYVADGSPEKETEIVERLAREGVPGLVVYSAHSSNSYEHLRAAQQAGMSIVVYDHDFPDLDINFVGIDDQLAAREATEHLIRLGCRELIMINSDRNWTTSVRRERGFEEAASSVGANLPRRVVRLSCCTSMAAYDAELRNRLLNGLDSMHKPVGIFAWYDDIAVRTIELLQGAGWSVPQDARVIGVNNDLSGELSEPSLTTMAIPREELTRLAAMALVNQINNQSCQTQRIRLKARMIIRESCGNYDAPVRLSRREIIAATSLTR